MSEAFHGRRPSRLCQLGLGLLTAATILSLSACGGGGGNGNGPNGIAGQSVSGNGNNSNGSGGGNNGGGGMNAASVTKAIPAAGGTVAVAPSATAALNVNFPAGAVPPNTPVTVATVPVNALPVSIAHAIVGKAVGRRTSANVKLAGRTANPRFTLNPNNIYIVAFQISATGVTAFNVPVNITGGSGLTPTGLPANTVLNIAELQNGSYMDVGTLSTTATGGFTQQQVSAVLPGIAQPGLYVVYEPAQGTNTTVANFGIALIADDSNGPGSLQVVNLFDSTGTPLATPILTSLNFPSSYDLDGQALTPDGSQGILVDGGNTVRFFSGVNTGVPIASTNTVDISSYGGDGDSVAILPNGDESIVSGDSPNSLLVISGILSGNPQTAATIPVPSNRDGVAISNDGRVLLARGGNGLTVFSITPTAPVVGALGGSIAHTFTQIADHPELGVIGQEDGRDGMAFSPKDSSRAIIIGDPNNGATVSLVTGLPNAPVVSSLRLRLPATRINHRAAPAERGKHPRLALTGVSSVSSVSVTPDGTMAIIGTDAGLVMVTGVNTGTLTQVGTPYSPTFTVNGTGVALAGIPTLGITLDGKYVVAITEQGNASGGTLLTIPIQAGGFGAPVGQLNGVAVPSNDQILIH